MEELKALLSVEKELLKLELMEALRLSALLATLLVKLLPLLAMLLATLWELDLTLLTLLLELLLELFANGANPGCVAEAVHILTNATTNKRAAIASTVFLCIMLYLRCVDCLTIYITVWKKTDS